MDEPGSGRLRVTVCPSPRRRVRHHCVLRRSARARHSLRRAGCFRSATSSSTVLSAPAAIRSRLKSGSEAGHLRQRQVTTSRDSDPEGPSCSCRRSSNWVTSPARPTSDGRVRMPARVIPGGRDRTTFGLSPLTDGRGPDLDVHGQPGRGADVVRGFERRCPFDPTSGGKQPSQADAGQPASFRPDWPSSLGRIIPRPGPTSCPGAGRR